MKVIKKIFVSALKVIERSITFHFTRGIPKKVVNLMNALNVSGEIFGAGAAADVAAGDPAAGGAGRGVPEPLAGAGAGGQPGGGPGARAAPPRPAPRARAGPRQHRPHRVHRQRRGQEAGQEEAIDSKRLHK